MKTYEIWSKGFYSNESEWDNAHLWGEQEGDSFLDACNKFFSGNESYEVINDRPVWWGSYLCDNEEEARKVFG